MTAKLIGEEGTLKGVELELTEGNEWVLGSNPDLCQLVVEDEMVAPQHLRLSLDDEGLMVESLAGAPTEVNEELLEEEMSIDHGDTLRFGDTTFRLYMVEEETQHMDDDVMDEVEGDSLFGEEEIAEEDAMEEESVSLLTGSRFLLKVVAGPNTGAEYFMEPGQQYVIGTDAGECDVVFHDISVSRQHARLSMQDGDNGMIEDLDSRNGVLIDGNPVEQQSKFEPNHLITIGTTAFLICDREQEATTVISPMIASAERATAEAKGIPVDVPDLKIRKGEPAPVTAISALLLLATVTGLLVMILIGGWSLLRTDEVVVTRTGTIEDIQSIVSSHPGVEHSFNEDTGRLLILGHVLLSDERNQLLYNLRQIDIVRSVTDNVVIDENIWTESNLIMSNRPAWNGVTMSSPEPGVFLLSGFLKTRPQYDSLANYLQSNFLYPDRLSNQVVVEENIITAINSSLVEKGLGNIVMLFNNGEVTLNGTISNLDSQKYNGLLKEFVKIPGVQRIRNFVVALASDQSLVDLTDQYEVTGYSNQGSISLNVVVNGRIYTRGDVLDGMTITSIRPGTVILERGNLKYKIDFQE
jgi:type III secretion system YscD/HrpQ family protein